jgi:hypothetical protein
MPPFGLIGTVIGLIGMFDRLGSNTSVENLAPELAISLHLQRPALQSARVNPRPCDADRRPLRDRGHGGPVRAARAIGTAVQFVPTCAHGPSR